MSSVTDGSLADTPNVGILSQTQYRVYDGLIAAGLCFCFLIGLPGNCLSLTYFVRSKKRNLPTLLYITACCIDIVSCVIHLPVTANLLNERNPGLLGNNVLCGIWYFTFFAVQIMSMFLVMMISITRAIVIVFPFYKIGKKSVFVSILLAFILWSLLSTLNIAHGEFYYSITFTYCAFNRVPLHFFNHLYYINNTVWIVMFPIIIFVAMVVSICYLKTQNSAISSQTNNRNASVTIVCFSLVFLICNCFTFSNAVLLTYSQLSSEGYFYFYRSTFMFMYSWQISSLLCVVLNATLNPFVYIFRFKEMRVWINEILRYHNRNSEVISAGESTCAGTFSETGNTEL